MNKTLINKYKNLGDFKGLSKNLKISTMTITCSLDIEFYLENIAKYIILKDDGIKSVKYGKGEEYNRSLYKKKKKNKKNKKQKFFYNQITILIKPEHNTDINIKLFNNGSIQMTGCKSIIDVLDVLKTLCIELKKIRGSINNETHELEIKPFVSNYKNLDIDQIKNFNISMINSNFDIGFEINRKLLFEQLLFEQFEVIFEPLVHAGVNLKYNYKNEKKVTILIFASGSIVITGANTCDQIKEAYEFIYKKLYDNYEKIHLIKNNIDIHKYLY